MSSFRFLRRVLAVDAAACLAMGIGLAAAAAPLAAMLGYPEYFVRGVGLALLPIGAFIGWLASRPAPPSGLVWLVILGNAAWVVESFVVLGQFAPNALGGAFTVAQALFVLIMSALEYAALTRARVALA